MPTPSIDRLSATINATPAGARVVFAGRFDVEGAHVARDVLQSIQRREAHLTLDLSQVRSIDAAGLGVLVAGIRRADANGGSLTVSQASTAVHQALQVMGLTGVLEAGTSYA